MSYSAVERALALALREADAAKAPVHKRERAEPNAFRGHKITVRLNGRPADDIGPSVIIEVTVNTISKLEAKLAAERKAREAGLKSFVILSCDIG